MKFKEPNIYTADEGKTFRRKADEYIMGDKLFLNEYIDGSADVIENYEEVEDSNADRQENTPMKFNRRKSHKK